MTLSGMNYVRSLARDHLSASWKDRSYAFSDWTGDGHRCLYTGTGAGYLARLTSYLFWFRGHRVVRSTHGGDNPLFHDPLWPTIDLPFASIYTTFGKEAARATQNMVAARQETRASQYPSDIVAAGSGFHRHLYESVAVGASISPQDISVISASFTGVARALPKVKLHDMVYLEWHARLLAGIRSLGFQVTSKRHPKGLLADRTIFGHACQTEIIQAGMTETLRTADAFIADIAGSAFIEALCTLKPVVLIDIPIRLMTAEGRRRLKESVEIVPAHFDERNRVTVDFEEVREAIDTPVDIESRKRFIDDYLLTPSPGYEAVVS